MSIPLNHHYVSQCQIKKFFNTEGKIFLYDKSKRNFYWKNSSKNIFSEKFSNSIFNNGEIDHETLEHDLKLFEDNYPSAVELISEGAKSGKISNDCYQSLVSITLFGISGKLRTPQRKMELDNLIEDLFGLFKEQASEEHRLEFEKTNEYKKHVSYSNLLKYSETALEIVELMGGLDFTIWYITSDDCFLLPDTSATTIRRKINTYFNPDIKEIAEVGFPLTDKIFIHARSKKLGQGKSFIAYVKTKNHQAVTDINLNLFHSSYNIVATSSESYLRNFMTQMK